MLIGGARPPLAPAVSKFPALFKLSKYTLHNTSFFGYGRKKFWQKRVDNATTESKALFGNVKNPCLLEI